MCKYIQELIEVRWESSRTLRQYFFLFHGLLFPFMDPYRTLYPSG